MPSSSTAQPTSRLTKLFAHNSSPDSNTPTSSTQSNGITSNRRPVHPSTRPSLFKKSKIVLSQTVPSMTLNSTSCTHAMSTVPPSQELLQPCPTNPPRFPQAVPLRSATSPISMATINDSMTTSLNRFEPLENAKETAPPHLQHAPEAPVQRTTAVVDPREIALHRRQQAATMTTGALQAKAALALIAASIQDPTAPMPEPRQQLVLPLDGQTK